MYLLSDVTRGITDQREATTRYTLEGLKRIAEVDLRVAALNLGRMWASLVNWWMACTGDTGSSRNKVSFCRSVSVAVSGKISRYFTVAGPSFGWSAAGALTTGLLAVVQEQGWHLWIMQWAASQINLLEQRTIGKEKGVGLTLKRVETIISRAVVVETHEVNRVGFRRVIGTFSNVIVPF